MTAKQISIIVAIARNNAIGLNNQLLWHLPNDLKRFKNITTGHTVVMGKNTFLSLPKGALPNRRNIVISDTRGEQFPGCETVYSIDEAIGLFDAGKENFIIGGASVYRQFLPVAQKLYLTFIHKPFEADTFFPEIDLSQWDEADREEVPHDESVGFSWSYVTLVRKS